MKSTDLEDYDTLATQKSLERAIESLKWDLKMERSERTLRLQYVIMIAIAIATWTILIATIAVKFHH